MEGTETVETTTEVTTTSTVVETATADQSYTSGEMYLYADDWHASSLSSGERIYQLTTGDGAGVNNYFFGQETYDRFCSNGQFDAEGLSNYLQVASYRDENPELGPGAEDGIYTFKGKVYAYSVIEDTDEVAEAECRANFTWGDGGARQLYVEDLENLKRDEEYDCVAEGSVELSNGNVVVVASDQDMEETCHGANDALAANCESLGLEHPSEEATAEAARVSDEARGSTVGSECYNNMRTEESVDEPPENKTTVDDEDILAQNGDEDEAIEKKETVPDEEIVRQNSEESSMTSSTKDNTGGSGGSNGPQEEDELCIE